MQKIIPHLWFEKEAVKSAEFYVAVFGGDSKIVSKGTLHDTPSGTVDMATFELAGHRFMAIGAGPLFKFNPSVSFFVCCETKEEVDGLWNKLSEGGSALMELGKYPFSERYGWLADKYGLSWQIMYMDGQPFAQKIVPAFMFVGALCGKVEEAMNFYTSVFQNSKVNYAMRYGKGEEPDKEGIIKHAGFILEGQQFSAMDSAHKHAFAFNEAVSFLVQCATQEEIDYYWGKLSAVPEAEQCGWLKDKYGISWQIVPAAMEEMMKNGSKEQIARVTQAFLKMKKFDLLKLQEAYEGR